MICNCECEIYSRVCGYYRPVQLWNCGKQEEFKERETFESVIKNESNHLSKSIDPNTKENKHGCSRL